MGVSGPTPVEWSETEPGLRATDAAGRNVTVRLQGWERGATAHEFSRRPDAVVAGTVRRIDLPDASSVLAAIDGPDPRIEGTTAIGDGRYRLRVDTDPAVGLRFDGPATLRTDRSVSLEFGAPRRVSVGLFGRLVTPDTTVTVPPTPAGFARAVTHAAAALRTTDPARSLPAMRCYPPRIAFGDLEVPATVAAATPETAIEIAVPETVEAVLTAAPLSYYLGADLTVGTDPPRLLAPGIDRSLAPLAERAPALLRRVFWLDALVRRHPDGATPEELSLLDAVDLDAATARDAPPADRLRRYLSAPFERIADDLPRWHLAVYVAPTVENARALPHLLDRLATVHLPEAEPLPARELMERSLDDFYRGDVPTADVQRPSLADASLHGWLAPGTPVDVFTATPSAFDHRLDALADASPPPSVTVVLNEPRMAGEDTTVADCYREAGASEVTVRRRLSREALAAVFAEGPDLLHFIGHCETGGLQCTDGFLGAADIPENNVETFFLNACGSFREGRRLVRTGSVTGGVTYRSVLDEQAATVGETFARLVLSGFCVERAVRLARRRVMMGKDYAVVGDGTHSLAGTGVPRVAEVTSTERGYRLVCRDGLDRAGETHTVTCGGDERTRFRGTPVSVDGADLAAFLEGRSLPVVLDGEFYWSEDLVVRLSAN